MAAHARWSTARMSTLNRTYPDGHMGTRCRKRCRLIAYNWTMTGPRSTTAVLRVLSTRNAALGDSTPVQAILVPSVTLNSPNSGTLGFGNTETISFTQARISRRVSRLTLTTPIPAVRGKRLQRAFTGTATTGLWAVMNPVLRVCVCALKSKTARWMCLTTI